jgi:cell division septation protein DedD
MSSRKAYRVQLSIPAALALTILGGVSLLVSFYMGMITGQSMRQVDFSQTPPPRADVPQAPDLTKEELEFFSMSEDGPEEVEIRLPGFERLKERTSQLQSAASSAAEPRPSDVYTREAEEEEAAEDAASATEGTYVTSEPAENMARPAQEPSTNYTVQVFSSKLRKNAEDMLNMLRDRGFPDAYIHTHINPDNSVLYRVRVGKASKEQAEDRAFQLRNLNFVDSIQITRI